MKRRKWMQLLLIAAFILVFWQYRLYDAMHTDTEAPIIELDDAQLLQVSVQDPKSALLQGVSARDRQDGDLTDRLVVEGIRLIDDSGMIAVNYAVADNSGNVAKITRKVQYTDYHSPRFRLTRPLIYEEHTSFEVLNAVSASDVLDGDIQHRIRATALTEESISDLGTHPVYFQVNNSIGDISELVIPVEVLAADRFEAELTLTDYLIYLPLGADFQAKNYLNEFAYGAETISLRTGLPENFSANISSDVSTQKEGVYTVTYRISYTVRNGQNADYDQKFTGYSRLIVVVEG